MHYGLSNVQPATLVLIDTFVQWNRSPRLWPNPDAVNRGEYGRCDQPSRVRRRPELLGQNSVAAGCDNKSEEDPMNPRGQFSDSSCTDQMHLAERELSAFVRAVTQLYGCEEAKLAAEDWLDESELMDSPPLLTNRNWRAVTIAASARLANQLSIASQQRTLLLPNKRQASEIPSSSRSPSRFWSNAVSATDGVRMRSERERFGDDPG